MGVDGEIRDDLFAMVNRIRSNKIKEYVQSDEMVWQLGVYAIILDAADRHLLYPLMEDPIQDDASQPSKMDRLLDPHGSK
eukprot:4345732-Pyramimonas_sp.AAC.1